MRNLSDTIRTDELRAARVAWLLTEGSVRAGECRLANYAVRGVFEHGTGYAAVWHAGRSWLAHRLVASVWHGELVDPDDPAMPVHVHHSCGAKSCLEPAHLVVADGRSNALESRRFAALEHHYAEKVADLTEHLVETHVERDALRAEAAELRAELERSRAELERSRAECGRLYERLERPADPPSTPGTYSSHLRFDVV